MQQSPFCPEVRAILTVAVYAITIAGGGRLVAALIRRYRVGSIAEERERGGLHRAGLLIGYLERFLVLTALLLHSPETVAAIFAVKSIARFQEFRRVEFAEYFRIGTMASLGVGLAGGALLR